MAEERAAEERVMEERVAEEREARCHFPALLEVRREVPQAEPEAQLGAAMAGAATAH